MRKGLQNLENNENNNYKIIAVDDEEGIIDSLSIFLKRSGYNFTGVTDPQLAIEKVKNEHFDLMILDANTYIAQLNFSYFILRTWKSKYHCKEVKYSLEEKGLL